MRVLVTGGAGFIGSHVCEALLQQGHDICLLDNFCDYYSPMFKRENIHHVKLVAKMCKKDVQVIEADVRDKSALDKHFSTQSYDAVIHLAACTGVRPSIENAFFYSDVNINGTITILECMRRHQVKNLVFASSSSIYGNSDKVPYSESDAALCPISPYAASKKAGELMCHAYHHLYSMNIACLRLFSVYGPRQRPDLAIYKFTDKIYANSPLPFFGDGKMSRDYTYVDDTVSGILLALDWVCKGEKKYEIFNIGESYAVSLDEVVSALENTIGKSATINRLPAPPGDVQLTWADISKAERVLGYKPKTSFEAGIEKFVAWFSAKRRGK